MREKLYMKRSAWILAGIWMALALGLAAGEATKEKGWDDAGKSELTRTIVVDGYILQFDIDDGTGILCKPVKIKGA